LYHFSQDEEIEEDEDDFAPRSPVPLPDADTCKPILVQLGFSLSERRKKGENRQKLEKRKD
jgi:hypothetical protein